MRWRTEEIDRTLRILEPLGYTRTGVLNEDTKELGLQLHRRNLWRPR